LLFFDVYLLDIFHNHNLTNDDWFLRTLAYRYCNHYLGYDYAHKDENCWRESL